jgi:hypothetical protein
VAARKKKRVRKPAPPVKRRRTKRPGQKVSPKSLKNLIPPKPGEVRNPKGNNQYTGLRAIRERALKLINENFEDLAATAIRMAKAGEPQMLKFILGAGFDIRAMQVLDDEGVALDFAELAKKARDAGSQK